MGTAILAGILSSLESSTNPSEGLPSGSTPSRFLACVTSPASEQRIEKALSKFRHNVQTYSKDHVQCVRDADLIILGCKPYMAEKILKQKGMKDALSRKTLVTILAGITALQLRKILYGFGETKDDTSPEDECSIVRALPNTAALIGESMTTISGRAEGDLPLPSNVLSIVTWIFERVGRVSHLQPTAMDAATALCGSGPAFCALIMEALADGALAMGVPRAEAQMMAAQTMRGATGLVLNGEHPAIVREKVSTPGGCTIGGLLVLEESCVRGTVSKAIREATVVANQLGKGAEMVNGTRNRG